MNEVPLEQLLERTIPTMVVSRVTSSADLRTMRAPLGFDYGRFDYRIVEGKVVLYDVNRTQGRSANPKLHTDTVEVLSKELRAILEQFR